MDALRGIAAATVLIYHFPRFFGIGRVSRGYLGVDFFFMLSGFVLTYAYQDRLDNGLPTLSFLKARVIRLYPLYLLGLGLGLVASLLQLRYGARSPFSTPVTFASILVLTGMALFFIPAPFFYTPASPLIFPWNGPSWSLFFELAANVVHAIVLRRRSWQLLTCAILISGACDIYAALHSGTMDFGSQRLALQYGFARVLFSYLFGMLLFTIWQRGMVRVRVNPILLAPVLVAVFFVPAGSGLSVVTDMLIVSLFFPILLLIAASSEPPVRFKPFSRLLGTSSYAMYILHAPFGTLFEQAWKVGLHRAIEEFVPWFGIVYLGIFFLFTIVLDTYYDHPLREFLRRRIAGDRPAS